MVPVLSAVLRSRLGFFTGFLVCGLSIYVVPALTVDGIQTTYRISLSILFLLSWLQSLRNRRFKKYSDISSAFFTVSIVDLLEHLLYSNWSSISWFLGSRMDQYVLAKSLSTILVVIPIILLTRASGNDWASIYLNRGRLRPGLVIGLATFLTFLATSVPVATMLYAGRNLTFGSVVSWGPWILAFVFSNAAKEELQFRGFFLRKYEAFLGVDASNVLQAMIFVLPHLGEVYSPVLLVFLIIVFFLGLAFGAVAQKTNSLLGSMLFHAGADIPVVLGIFSNL